MILLMRWVDAWGFIMDRLRLSVGWCSHHKVPAGSCTTLHHPPSAFKETGIDYEREVKVW